MRLRQVVLPAPLGPMRLTISPDPTPKVISESASRPPNRLETLFTSSIAGRSATVGLVAPCDEAHDAARQKQHHGHDDQAKYRKAQLLEIAQILFQQHDKDRADDRANQRPLAAGQNHDDHGNHEGKAQHFRTDKGHVVGVEAAREARDTGREYKSQEPEIEWRNTD